MKTLLQLLRSTRFLQLLFALLIGIAGSTILIHNAGWKIWAGVFLMLWANNIASDNNEARGDNQRPVAKKKIDW